MTAGPPVVPLASADEPVRYVIIDDEPRYRQGLGAANGARLVQVGAAPADFWIPVVMWRGEGLIAWVTAGLP
jgi:hypothetical protein